MWAGQVPQLRSTALGYLQIWVCLCLLHCCDTTAFSEKLSRRTRGAAFDFCAGFPHIWDEEHGQICNWMVTPFDLQYWLQLLILLLLLGWQWLFSLLTQKSMMKEIACWPPCQWAVESREAWTTLRHCFCSACLIKSSSPGSSLSLVDWRI